MQPAGRERWVAEIHGSRAVNDVRSGPARQVGEDEKILFGKRIHMREQPAGIDRSGVPQVREGRVLSASAIGRRQRIH